METNRHEFYLEAPKPLFAGQNAEWPRTKCGAILHSISIQRCLIAFANRGALSVGIYVHHNRPVSSDTQTPATPLLVTRPYATPAVTSSSTTTWLSPGRLGTYLQVSGGDHDLAMDLYSWNCDLASACARDLGHLEVAVRNAYHRAVAQMYPDWLWSHQGPGNAPVSGFVFANSSHHVPTQKVNDLARLNKGAVSALFNARRKAGVGGNHTSNSGVPDGKILANLTFGFWAFLTEPLRANVLWNQALGNIPGIPSRAWMHTRMLELNNFRNRVAHMEPLVGSSSGLVHNLMSIDEVLNVMVEPDVLDWISATSRVPEIFSEGLVRGVLTAPPSTYLKHALV
jgi:hypothetical protein